MRENTARSQSAVTFKEFVQQFGKPGKFRPHAFHNQNMDDVTYLIQDCSCDATRIHSVIEVLRDSHEDKVVGIRICGPMYFFNVILGKTIFGAIGRKLYIRIIIWALEHGIGKALIDLYQKELSEKEQVSLV